MKHSTMIEESSNHLSEPRILKNEHLNHQFSIKNKFTTIHTNN
ncbi:MAG: hypothetical protein AABZ32_09380 [Bacteroidota bacterium]